MPIDYSKWDKIELSDDSDIEVHPNVDKNSFIRWKQRDIHEKRHQRNIEIKSILVQLTMYSKLNERVDFLLAKADDDTLLENAKVMSKLREKFSDTEKFDYEKLKKEKGSNLRKGLVDLTFENEELENTPTYNEMIEDLFIQVREDNPTAATLKALLVEKLKEHRAKIDDVLSKQTIKLDELLYQKASLISSDDIHTGFDRSFLNKDDETIPKAAPNNQKESVTTTEVINSPSKGSSTAKNEETPADDLTLDPATAEFSKISDKVMGESATFLINHHYICTEQQKDALIMTAFDHQLKGDSQTAKQVIHQSLILQYIAQLAGSNARKDQTIKAIKLFCSKISIDNGPARHGFVQDVENTFNHIKTRCEVLTQEQMGNDEDDNGEEALIQLKALDDATQLLVNIPAQGTPEYHVFQMKLSPGMQDAVRTTSLEEVNKELAKLTVEEAENILEIFNECGVIGISGYLEDENEFKQLQQQYHDELHVTDANTREVGERVETEDVVD